MNKSFKILVDYFIEIYRKIFDFVDLRSNTVSLKRAEARRLVFLVLFGCVIYFLFLSVLPGNERLIVCAVDDCGVPGTGDGDYSSDWCTAYGGCNGGPVWQIGGEVDALACCGDDITTIGSTANYVIAETGDTDAPAGYNDGETACCSTGTDCTYNDVCYDTTSASGDAIPSKAYCNAGTWQGGDDAQSACDMIVGAGYWNLGGDTASTTCCGDDGGLENRITETGDADAPAAYTGGITTCCDSSTDCTYDDTCYSTTNVSLVAIPNKAYCNSGTWEGGDDGQTYCDAIVGSGYWNIGGETASTTCCGDDGSSENKLYKQVDESIMEGGIADNPSDIACCIATTDCVNSSTCTNTLSSGPDVDGDGDVDYCLDGIWRDCYTDTDCNLGETCSSTTYDCVGDTDILIKNLGTTGIEQTNQEYTSQRTVMLFLTYGSNAINCRYSNEGVNWTSWEPCIGQRIWELSEDAGLKEVHYQVNLTTVNATVNDTIYYNYTGTGLDLTPPSQPTVSMSGYTNDNTTITVSWTRATDPESEIFNIPLVYNVLLYLDNGTTIYTGSTTDITIDATGFDELSHNDTIYCNLTVVNSANLKSYATGGPTIIDLVPPSMNNLYSSFYNITDSTYYSLPDFYVRANRINLSWTGSDDLSGVYAYSYVLTQDNSTNVDTVPEGTVGNFASEVKRTYSNLKSGEYYFKIIARDNAGNWGSVFSKHIFVDSTAGSRPEILTESVVNGDMTYTWSSSIDDESGINYYVINLSYTDGTIYLSNKTGSTSFMFYDVPTSDYNITVGSVNNVGIWRWSNQEEEQIDFTAPVIIALPNVTVVSRNPILKVWTDEDAVCYYNLSTGDRKFVYSNTTYHETKVSSSGSKGAYRITCEDPSGNSDYVDINFTIDTSLVPVETTGITEIGSYRNTIKNFQIEITDTDSNRLSGITSPRFSMTLNDEGHNINAFDTGRGFYNISFVTPKEVGTYALKLYVDAITVLDINLTNEDLYLVSTYEDVSIVPESEERITYYDGSKRIGFGTSSEVDLRSKGANGLLNISEMHLEEELYIFNTKKTRSMSERDTRLKKDSFMRLINPSFGYTIDEDYLIHFILSYDNYLLISEIGDELNIGQHSFIVLRSVNSDGQIVIKFIDNNQNNNRVVVKG